MNQLQSIGIDRIRKVQKYKNTKIQKYKNIKIRSAQSFAPRASVYGVFAERYEKLFVPFGLMCVLF